MSSSNPTVVINYGPMRTSRIRRNGYRQRNTNGVYYRRNIQLNVSDTIQEDTLNRIVNFPRQQGVNNQLVDQFFNGSSFCCWSSDPQERPSMKKVCEILGSWYFRNKNIGQFNEAELKRRDLINSKKLSPHFTVYRHSEAIYTSRSLQEYITKAYEFDINNTLSSSNPSLNFTIQNPLTVHNQNANNTNSSIISRKRKIEESNVENNDNGRKCIKINKSR
ncbi:hypothetical protein C1646_750362 [Rhizophagus diaphanus]|nr:hypothetical protein C1646_750362 [Rhizophagus diaphanus] [Rhizophagus sp. MUCL 43196]